MSKSPPSSITDIERVIGLLGDIVDGLESQQAINPSQAIEAIAADARFARDSLARITVAHLDALQDFVRELRAMAPCQTAASGELDEAISKLLAARKEEDDEIPF